MREYNKVETMYIIAYIQVESASNLTLKRNLQSTHVNKQTSCLEFAQQSGRTNKRKMPPKKESKPAGGSKQAAASGKGGKGAKAADAKGR